MQKKKVLATKRLTLFIYLKDVFLYARHLSTYSHRRCSNVIIQKVSNFTIKWIHELECNFILYLRWQTIIVTLSRPTVIDVFKIDVNNNTRLVTCLRPVCINRWKSVDPSTIKTSHVLFHFKHSLVGRLHKLISIKLYNTHACSLYGHVHLLQRATQPAAVFLLLSIYILSSSQLMM